MKNEAQMQELKPLLIKLITTPCMLGVVPEEYQWKAEKELNVETLLQDSVEISQLWR